MSFRTTFVQIATMAACLVGSLGTAGVTWAGQEQPGADRAPNIVVILADDLGWEGVGYNDSWIRTPNIDRLAGQGVQLTNFYVSPMCSPTRAGLLTARYPMRMGMARSVVRPWANYGLPPAEQTLAEALAKTGYRHRGIFGKWHLGHLDPVWHPLSQGFSEFQGQYNGAADYWTRIRQDELDWHKDGSPLEVGGYTTDLIADAACEFIKRHAGEGPFFCYVPFTAPHDPFQAPESYVQAYANEERVKVDRLPASRDRQVLAAMVTCMDDGIGRIMRSLQEAKVADNTLVWFFSDNGGLTRLQLNGSLREGKLTVYEGGVRVPSTVCWPGVIEGGRRIDRRLINLDIMPTLLGLIGKSKVLADNLDGVDASGLLTSRSSSLPGRDLYFFNGQSGLEREQIAIISEDDWKLVVIGPDIRRPRGYRTPAHRVELFKIDEDPNEQNDLAAQRPEVVGKLGEKLVAFRKSEPAGALEPSNRPPADFKPPSQWRNHPVADAG